MEALYKNLVWIHVAAGFGGLVLLWGPLLSAKGGRTHRRIGWAYVACMSVVVASAFAMVAMLLVDPLAVKPLKGQHSPETVAKIVSQFRAYGMFLGMLGMLTFAAGWGGITVLRHKNNPEAMRTPFNIGVSALLALVGAAVMVMGFRHKIWLLVFLGPIGLWAGIDGVRTLLHPPKLKMGWWYDHLGGMMGSGITTYTAFTVFGAQRLMPDIGQTALFPLFWLTPIAAGIIASEWMTRHYKRKFGDLPLASGDRPDATSTTSANPE